MKPVPVLRGAPSAASRPVLPLIVAAVLVGGCSRPAPEPEPIRAVKTVQVSDGVSAPLREFAAETRARTESRLSFRVAGKIVARQVELGQTVKAGQVLAQLDPTDLQQSQQAAAAAVAAAQANYDLAAADHKRYAELRDQGFIGAAELERRTMTLKTAQAQLDQARAQAAVQRNQAGYATLTATTGGVVVAVEADVGSVVSAGTPVIRLALDGPRDAVFFIAEDALPAMRQLLDKPEALQVRVWGAAAPVKATLHELAASADPVTRTYQARADLGRASVQLGQTAAVLVQSPPRPGLFRLPLPAVVRQGDRAGVWVLDRATMTVRQTPVTVHGADGNEVLIDSGLTSGMDVVVAGAHVLTPGQKVKIYAGATPPSSAGTARAAAIGASAPAASAAASAAPNKS